MIPRPAPSSLAERKVATWKEGPTPAHRAFQGPPEGFTLPALAPTTHDRRGRYVRTAVTQLLRAVLRPAPGPSNLKSWPWLRDATWPQRNTAAIPRRAVPCSHRPVRCPRTLQPRRSLGAPTGQKHIMPAPTSHPDLAPAHRSRLRTPHLGLSSPIRSPVAPHTPHLTRIIQPGAPHAPAGSTADHLPGSSNAFLEQPNPSLAHGRGGLLVSLVEC